MWKIVGALKVSVLYIDYKQTMQLKSFHIYKQNNNNDK